MRSTVASVSLSSHHWERLLPLPRATGAEIGGPKKSMGARARETAEAVARLASPWGGDPGRGVSSPTLRLGQLSGLGVRGRRGASNEKATGSCEDYFHFIVQNIVNLLLRVLLLVTVGGPRRGLSVSPRQKRNHVSNRPLALELVRCDSRPERAAKPSCNGTGLDSKGVGWLNAVRRAMLPCSHGRRSPAVAQRRMSGAADRRPSGQAMPASCQWRAEGRG